VLLWIEPLRYATCIDTQRLLVQRSTGWLPRACMMPSAHLAAPSAFRFPGKIRYHCVVTDPTSGDSICIASVPSFASPAACDQLIALAEQTGFGREAVGSGYSQATVDLEVDSSPAVRAYLLEKDFIATVSQCMRATHERAMVIYLSTYLIFCVYNYYDICHMTRI
jgi:hypothetical protein